MKNYQPLVDKLKEAKRLFNTRPCESSLDTTIRDLITFVEDELKGFIEDQENEIEEQANNGK